MLRVVREVRPDWIVGENVAGLLSMDGGKVFERILLDLEGAGYSWEVYVLPAIGLGAPHQRERVWIVAHCDSERELQQEGLEREERRRVGDSDQGFIAHASCVSKLKQGNQEVAVSGEWFAREEFVGGDSAAGHISNAKRARLERAGIPSEPPRPDWIKHWYEVATRICRVDDGLPGGVDGTGELSAKPKKQSGYFHRLKALGNSIVPHLAYEIFKAIQEFEDSKQH